jgi:hypothetical protein
MRFDPIINESKETFFVFDGFTGRLFSLPTGRILPGIRYFPLRKSQLIV